MAPREEPLQVYRAGEGAGIGAAGDSSSSRGSSRKILHGRYHEPESADQENSPSGLWRTLGKRVG